jgi:hypothetical protein
MTLLNAATVPRAEKVIRRGSCLAGDIVGDCVMLVGPVAGGLYDVAKFDPTVGGRLLQAIGVIIAKQTSTTCWVQLSGPMPNVYAGLTPGGFLWVGADSQLTHTSLSDPDIVQSMGHAIDATEVMLTIMPPAGVLAVGFHEKILTSITGTVIVDSLTGHVMVTE